MIDKNDPDAIGKELRRKAERVAGQKAAKGLQKLSVAAVQKMLHEMRVHQIELEMQNEELRTAQENLEESREQYFELYNAAPVGYLSVSEKGIILVGNLTAANQLGVAQLDLHSKPIAGFIYRGDRNIFHLFSKKLFETKEPQLCELRMLRRDGSQFWARVDGKVAQDSKSGKAICLATMSDITLKKYEESALQAERDRAQMYIAIAGVILVFLGPDQTISLINKKGCELLGYANEELIGKNWFDLIISKDERSKVKGVFMQMMKGEVEPVEYYENYVLNRNGEKRLISWHNTLVKDADGNISGTLSSGEDITEREQTEKDLRNSESKFRALYENAPILIDAFNADGRCTMWNNECQKVFGWTLDEINAHAEPLALFYPDPDVRKEVMESVTVQPGNIFREWQPVTKKGEKLTVLWANFQLPGGEVINLGHDISERKRLEEEQQKLARLESIGILAAGIAHNFNNILTAVLGNISLAKKDTVPGGETHEILEDAEKASLRAKDLTAQLLTFAKGGAPVKRLFNIAKLLQDATNFSLTGTDVKCQFSIPADLWQVEIDPVQVSQVIYNLANNAQQATPTGGSIELKAENLSLREKQGGATGLPLEPGDYIRIGVTDHGAGIPQEILNKIFDPFFTTKTKAIGLGLSTVLSIVRRHGGHVSIDTKAGAGSTVYVYFPVASENGHKH